MRLSIGLVMFGIDSKKVCEGAANFSASLALV
jgi:hypothetical protein